MDWNEEMNKMLGGFERQAIYYLGNIKLSFKSNGLTFDQKFKQYFLQASINRLEQTYNQIQLDEEIFGHVQVHSSASNAIRNTGTTISLTHIKSELENQTHTLFEIDDSSNEEGVSGRANTMSQSVQRATAKAVSPFGSVNEIDNSNYGLMTTDDVHKATIQMTHHIDESGANENHSSHLDANINLDSTFVSNTPNTLFGIVQTQHYSPNFNRTAYGLVSEEVEAVNQTEGDESNDRIPVNKKVDIKPKFKEMDDEVPLVLIEVKRKAFASFDDNEVCHDSTDTHGTVASLANTSLVSVPNNSDGMVQNGKQSVPKQSIPQKRFRCTVCEFSSKWKGNLDRHTLTHTGEKPYRCDRCGKRFPQARNLKVHAVTHTDVFPFHCFGCFRGFSQKAEKEAHDKVCVVRRYECHICKKFMTSIKTLLKRHMRSHTGEQPFRCEICLMKFTQKGSLKAHLNKIHGKIH